MSTPTSSRAPGRLAALFLIAQFVLMWSAFIILYSAINWPISLDDPASLALPRLITEANAVAIGYACYLFVGLLLIPATAALNTRLGLTGAIASTTIALATFSAIAKSIGITRWLFVMPSLAEAYSAPGADQGAIALLYNTLNAYAGGIGEILGVGLMSGVWTLLIGVAVIKAPGPLPKLIGAFAFMTGLGLLATIPAGFGVDLGPVLTLSGVVWQFALLAIALWALTAPRAAST